MKSALLLFTKGTSVTVFCFIFWQTMREWEKDSSYLSNYDSYECEVGRPLSTLIFTRVYVRSPRADSQNFKFQILLLVRRVQLSWYVPVGNLEIHSHIPLT